LIEKGTDGLSPCGSTGEFIAMTLEERKHVVEVVIDQVNGRVPVYPGTGHYSTELTIELSKHAEKCGAAGVLVILPYYMRPPKKDVPDHYKAVANAIDIPIILYNNPWFAGYEMTSFEIKDMVDEGSISAVKVTNGDPSRVHDLKVLCGDKLSVLYGHDYNVIESFVGGADGFLSGLPTAVPDLSKKIFTLVQEGIWDRIFPLIWFSIPWKKEKNIETSSHFTATYKVFLKVLGVDVGVPRKPVKPLSGKDWEEIKEIAKHIYI